MSVVGEVEYNDLKPGGVTGSRTVKGLYVHRCPRCGTIGFCVYECEDEAHYCVECGTTWYWRATEHALLIPDK